MRLSKLLFAFLLMPLVGRGQEITNVSLFTSLTGVAGSWTALMGSGSSPLGVTPLRVGIYCSNDGTGKAGTWVPCQWPATTPLFQFQGYGDSYVFGTGATTPAIGSGFAQLSQTIRNVPSTNYGVSGLNSDSINFNVWALAQPSPQQASAYLFNSGSNDDHNCGISAPCLANFSETVNSSISYLAIPNQERVFGSACTQTAGTWTADTASYPAPVPLYYLAPGSAVSASGTGAILTCTVTSRAASTRVGLNFQVTNAQTGTFTVTVDGVPQTDTCSGTTTFTSAPCGANLLTRTTAVFRQEFTGTPGTSHTVVITTTNAAKVDVTAVDTITTAPQANSNYVIVLGPNGGFDTGTTYNDLLSAISNQFASDGARVAFASQQTGNPGVNAHSTDTATTATANCTASTQSDHPNDVCGYYHLAQTVVNATRAVGWNIFGTPQAFSNPLDLTTFMNTISVSTAGNPGALIVTYLYPITIKRLDWSVSSLGVGCGTPVISFVVNNVVQTSFTVSVTGLNTTFFGRGDGILYVPANSKLQLQTTTGSGCTTQPSSLNATMHYVMQ